ncbi:MAG TPA: hypothetical protein VGQ83_02635 [Polyangia bacterium]|jgi:hypothetical protein
MRLRSIALLVLLIAVAALPGCCQRLRQLSPIGSGGGPRITLAELPPDPLAAARLVGEAAATEKDPDRLAGLVASFMQRLKVPVVNAAGDGLLVPGQITKPLSQVLLFEQPLHGLAKATAEGDARLLSAVVKAYVPEADQQQLRRSPLGPWLARSAREIQRKKVTTPEALLVLALATDLQKRGQLDREDPRLDPVGSLLLGLWLMTGLPAPQGPPPAELMRPIKKTAPKRAPAKGVMKDLGPEALGDQMSLSGLCAMASKAAKWQKGLGGVLSGTAFGGSTFGWGSVEGWSKGLGEALGPWKLANTITQAIAGMGIAAVIDVTGEVKPVKTWYSGPTVYYEVFVDSKNPYSKEQMDKFVDCLEALSLPGASGMMEELRNIPPKGPVEGAWVTWTGGAALDPPHGKFDPKQAVTMTAPGIKAGASRTGKDGKSKADFRPKEQKGKEHKFTKIHSVTIFANVMPFPMGVSPVYMASNVISSREVPLRVEIEVPLPKNWLFEFTEEDLVTGEGIQGGWSVSLKASIPFTLDENLRFDSPGSGTWNFSFKGGMGGIMRCEAPVNTGSFSAKVHGNVQNVDTLMTEFNLQGNAAGGINTALKCTVNMPGNIKVKPVPLKGPAGTGDTIQGPMKKFTMPLEAGGTKTWTFTENKGNAQRQVTAKVKLTPRED